MGGKVWVITQECKGLTTGGGGARGGGVSVNSGRIFDS